MSWASAMGEDEGMRRDWCNWTFLWCECCEQTEREMGWKLEQLKKLETRCRVWIKKKVSNHLCLLLAAREEDEVSSD